MIDNHHEVYIRANNYLRFCDCAIIISLYIHTKLVFPRYMRRCSTLNKNSARCASYECDINEVLLYTVISNTKRLTLFFSYIILN